MTDRRVLPNDTEAEASILGGILLRNEMLALLPDLGYLDFYDPRHQAVFAAMRDLEARATPIDTTTVEFELARHDKLDACGGIGFLGELSLKVPTADNVVAYAAIVTKLSQARSMMLALGDLAEAGYTHGLEDADEYVAAAERKVLEISRRGRTERPRAVNEIVMGRVRELEDLAARKARGEQVMIGIPTGIEALDAEIGGLPRSIVVIVGGRAKMGKTSVIRSFAHAASAAGIGVMEFSLEDGPASHAESAIARYSGIPASQLRRAELSRGDMHGFGLAMAELRKRDNWRVEYRVLDAQSICRELRRAKAEIPALGLGIVDYVQIVRRPPRLTEDQAIREAMTHFQAIAKELDICLVVVSQINREAERRGEDKRPTMADLHGSGSLEQLCKMALLCYRGAAYYESPKKTIDYDCSHLPGYPCGCAPADFEEQMQIIIAADNQGETGRVFAKWHGPTKTVS